MNGINEVPNFRTKNIYLSLLIEPIDSFHLQREI